MCQMNKLACSLVAIAMFLGHSAYAQQNPYYRGYTVTTPGQPPTFVNPNRLWRGLHRYDPWTTTELGGGYTVTTPGQPRAFIDPNNPYGR
jgi:hypothetical protein